MFSFTAKVCALLVLVAAGALLLGPASFGPDEPSAEAALFNELKKLLASDAQEFDIGELVVSQPAKQTVFTLSHPHTRSSTRPPPQGALRSLLLLAKREAGFDLYQVLVQNAAAPPQVGGWGHIGLAGWVDGWLGAMNVHRLTKVCSLVHPLTASAGAGSVGGSRSIKVCSLCFLSVCLAGWLAGWLFVWMAVMIVPLPSCSMSILSFIHPIRPSVHPSIHPSIRRC